jgi:hypothetical protein
MSEKRWMSSGYLQAAPIGAIDNEQGIIEGVSVVTVGEAEGHGINLDSEFVREVIKQGNDLRQGVKVRFGHPNMCSTALGTFLGRAKNFREGKTERDGSQVEAALADIFLSNEAKATPHGNLYNYVLGMAQNEPDMFGTSIVFTPGRIYRRDGTDKVFAPGERVDKGERGADWEEWREIDGPDFVEMDELHAADAVDDPAANEGLFSRFAKETIAGQITEFFDLNPAVWRAVESNPSIIEALARYGDKVDEFVERYRAYRGNSRKGDDMFTKKDKANSEQLEDKGAAAEATEAAETEDVKPDEKNESAEASTEVAAADGGDATETTEGAEATAETGADADTGTEEAEKTDDTAAEAPPMSRAEFARIADEFGDEVAAKVMKDGGGYNDALKVAYDDSIRANSAGAAVG